MTLYTFDTENSPLTFCSALDLSRDEVLNLSVQDFHRLSRNVMNNTLVQHAIVYHAWKEALIDKRETEEDSDEDRIQTVSPCSTESASEAKSRSLVL